MATKFADFVREIEAEAEAEGPDAVEQLKAFQEHFRIGRKLAEARVAKNLSQKEVAVRAQVNQADVSNIERGRANPTFKTLSAVAFAVGCELDVKRRRRA